MATLRKDEIDVSKEDQANINNFSKLNQKFHEKIEELKIKERNLEEQDDALTELELLEDESSLRLKFGECFIRVDTDTCRDYLEKVQETTKKETGDCKKEVDEIQKKMMKLKSTLYSKFGNSIQLEE